MSAETMRDHDVLRVLRERAATGSQPTKRNDGHHVVLAIEGGGNRGVISGGMAATLVDEGLVSAFDAVYGSSSGALTGAWLLSSELRRGLVAWAEPSSYSQIFRLTNPLRRKPLFDLEWLIEEFYDKTLRLDADHVLANPISLHPLATDAKTGESVDLGPLIKDKKSLHTALRASAALPILAGNPVPLGDSSYVDAGVAEGVPLDTPIAAGATHILVLASRKRDDLSADSSATRWVTRRWLDRAAPGARDPFMARNTRAGEVAARLDKYNDGDSTPSVMTVRPADHAPVVGRAETSAAAMRAGAEAGEEAMRRALCIEKQRDHIA